MPEEERWHNYYEATKQKPPNALLLDALSRIELPHAAEPPFAIDLGCGNGQDTHALLRYGWRVLAIDKQPEAIRNTVENAPPDQRQNLEARVSTFEALTLSPCHLIFASVSLPFCVPTYFD